MTMPGTPSALHVKVAISNETDIVVARQAGRQLASTLGFSSTEQTLLATAISEVARNIVVYAQTGELRLARVESQGRIGVEVIASDRGPGIESVDLAMRDGYSTKRSLGLGLPGAKRLVDDFELVSELGVGTTVTMRKWRR